MAMVFAMAIVAAMTCACAAQAPARQHQVEITSFRFVPASISVKPGDMITWTNLDIVPHTASSTDGSWDTGTLLQNESASLVVGKSWTSSYRCRFHVNMTGTVAIEP